MFLLDLIEIGLCIFSDVHFFDEAYMKETS